MVGRGDAMKISIVTVTYNASAFLEGALQSLRVQTYPNTEFIVIDGGSSDGTLNLVASYPDLKPIVHSGPDNGIYDAMNKGVRVATGEAIYFLNADDRLAQPDSLACLVDGLRRNPGAGIVYGNIVVTDQNRDTWRSHRRWTPARLGWEALCHQATLSRRDVFDRAGEFDTNYRISADLEWFMRCDSVGVDFAHVDRLICFYAAGGESDRQGSLRRQENERILRQYRGAASRFQQRVAAALRRRLPFAAAG